MFTRVGLLTALLLLAGGLITYGVALWSTAAGFITGGVLLAVLALLLLAEVVE